MPATAAVASTLHLVVPGLLALGRLGRIDPALLQPAAPALAWLLARADDCAAPAASDDVLFEAFGVPVPTATDGPVAAVTRLVDGGNRDDGWWLRADPVHLRPDLKGVWLADARILALEPDEAQALVAAFNQTFAADGLQLDAPRPDRWYLRLPTDPGIRTCPLIDAIGRDIHPLLPHGPSERRWRTLLTEAQMLFYAHPVNQNREQRNQPLANGLWLWGGGPCPTGVRTPAAGLYAQDPLARGLARLAGAAIAPLPPHAADWRDAAAAEASSLVVLEDTRHATADGDPAAWVEQVATLERSWFAPCRQWLQTGRLQALRLDPGNGRRYQVSGAARWRFWRRTRPLAHYGTAPP